MNPISSGALAPRDQRPSPAHVAAVRPAQLADLPAIGNILSRAFFDDPVMRWVLPDDGARWRLAPALFELFAGATQPLGLNRVTRDLAGAAIWVPPGQPAVAEDQAVAFGRLVEELAGPYASRAFEIVELLDDHHPHGSFYYLWLLGVVSESQGQGIGSALMAPMLLRSDRESLPVYLEATSEGSQRLYGRHGFRAGAPIVLAGGPPLWPMWRAPGATL